MAVQLNFPDTFGHENPQAYLRIEHADWDLGSGGLQIAWKVYANKAAADAGKDPVSSASAFVPYDTTALTGYFEQQLMLRPEIAAGSPSQVS